MNVAALLNFVSPGCYRTIASEYQGSSPAELQAFLDSEVEWILAPVSAATLVANEAAYDAVVAAAESKRAVRQVSVAAISSDPDIIAMLSMTPAEIDAEMDNLTTIPPQVREVLKRIVKAMSVLADQRFNL